MIQGTTQWENTDGIVVSLQYLQYSHDLKMKTQKPNAVRCAQTAEMRIADELLCFPLVSICFRLSVSRYLIQIRNKLLSYVRHSKRKRQSAEDSQVCGKNDSSIENEFVEYMGAKAV